MAAQSPRPGSPGPATRCAPAPAGATTFTYDQNGNLLTFAEPSGARTFGYDVWNQMTSVTSGAVTVTYTYDGQGQKVRRQGPSGAQRYYYDYFADVPRILAEADAGSGTFQTIYQRDLFGNLLSDGATWHQFDGLGSIVSRTNSSGALAGSTLYGAWGTVRSQSGTQGKWGFTGAEWDPDAKGYHIGARWYDPSLGRWWAEDPKRDRAFSPGTLNFYAYSFNSPLVIVDRNGREGCAQLTTDSAAGGGGSSCGGLDVGLVISDPQWYLVDAVEVGLAKTLQFGLRVVKVVTVGGMTLLGKALTGTGVGAAVGLVIGGALSIAAEEAINEAIADLELQEGWIVSSRTVYDPATRTSVTVVVVYDPKTNKVIRRKEKKKDHCTLPEEYRPTGCP